MTLKSAIPALPVRDVAVAVEFYAARLGFAVIHAESGFAVLRRDAVEIHLWEANDPKTPGAEPFIAGTASCRIQVTDLDVLYEEMTAAGVVHPNGKLKEQPWGVRDFATLDQDNNLITYFEPVENWAT